MTATQGHTYNMRGKKVLALESGKVVRVAIVEAGQPWLGKRMTVNSSWLKPIPMAYFHGDTPK